MSNYYIASCSCGKDSMAMVCRLIEEDKPCDEIVFYDTGMEFKAIYKNWSALQKYATERKIKCTTLKPECDFLWKMLHKPVNVGKPNEHKGYSWCGGVCRWGTTEKLKSLDKYAEEKNAIVYVGIAADETARLQKERKPYKRFPLAEWGMTEAECLSYCRSKGIHWREPTKVCGAIDLYDILDRVSCWCCGNKNLWELYNLWKYLYDDYWCRLRYLQFCNKRPFKSKYTIFDLEEKFNNGYIPKRRNPLR